MGKFTCFFGEWMTPKLLTQFVFTFHLIHLLLSKVACLPMPLQLIGFNLVVRTRSFEGVVGEILGDGILAFWNTPDAGHPDLHKTTLPVVERGHIQKLKAMSLDIAHS